MIYENAKKIKHSSTNIPYTYQNIIDAFSKFILKDSGWDFKI